MYSQVRLIRYPLVIDPAVRALEVLLKAQIERGAINSTRTYWYVLSRLQRRWNWPLSIDNSTPHIFGNSTRLSRCTMALAYGPKGRIVAVYHREHNNWISETLPEEVTGNAACFPSLRITFSDENQRQQFVDLLHNLRQGGSGRESGTINLPDAASDLIQAALRDMRWVPVALPPGSNPIYTS